MPRAWRAWLPEREGLACPCPEFVGKGVLALLVIMQKRQYLGHFDEHSGLGLRIGDS